MNYSADTILSKLAYINEALSIVCYDEDDEQDFYGIELEEQQEYKALLQEIKTKVNKAIKNVNQWR